MLRIKSVFYKDRWRKQSWWRKAWYRAWDGLERWYRRVLRPHLRPRTYADEVYRLRRLRVVPETVTAYLTSEPHPDGGEIWCAWLQGHRFDLCCFQDESEEALKAEIENTLRRWAKECGTQGDSYSVWWVYGWPDPKAIRHQATTGSATWNSGPTIDMTPEPDHA